MTVTNRELMVGNFISSRKVYELKNEPVEVSAVIGYPDSLNIKINGGYKVFTDGSRIFRSIPLSKEILECTDLEETAKGSGDYKIRGVIIRENDELEGHYDAYRLVDYYNTYNVFRSGIKYLHELQNFILALTCKNLKVDFDKLKKIVK